MMWYVEGPPGASTNTTSLSFAMSSRVPLRIDLRLNFCLRSPFSEDEMEEDEEEDGLVVKTQCSKPKGTRRDSVACAIRPKPMNPAVRVWVIGFVLSWGPQSA